MTETSDGELDGLWQMVRGELDSVPTPGLVAQNTTLVITRGTYRVCFQGETADEGLISLSGAPAGKILLLIGREGPNAGRRIPGLYQIKGQRLRICFGLNGTVPTEFKSSDQDMRYLVNYRKGEAYQKSLL